MIIRSREVKGLFPFLSMARWMSDFSLSPLGGGSGVHGKHGRLRDLSRSSRLIKWGGTLIPLIPSPRWGEGWGPCEAWEGEEP